MNREKVEVNTSTLRDYIMVLFKRKKIFIATVVVSLVIGVFTTVTKPKIYEAKTVMRTGVVSGPVFPEAEVLIGLKNKKLLESLRQALNLSADVRLLKRMITVEAIADTDFVRVRVHDFDPVRAAKIAETLVALYIADGNIIYEQKIALAQEYLQSFSDKIAVLEKDINNLHQMSVAPEVNLDFWYIKNTLANYEYLHRKTIDQVYTLKNQLLNAHPFELYEAPTISRQAVSPRTTSTLQLAFVIGVILGIFLAFCQESWLR